MGNFGVHRLDLEGAFLIDCFSAGDNRGGFTKIFEKDIYKRMGIDFDLNESFYSESAKNVIRGLHFQGIDPQAKIVSVIKGKVYDVIVDIRQESKTFGKWLGVELSSNNKRALYVPKGFAHGFASLEDGTIMLYQCEGKYNKESDSGIIFNDKELGIEWPISESEAIVSGRDANFKTLYDTFRG